jgi:plasmid stabilization system protein ParE
MRVRYTGRAFANREAAFDFIEKRSPQSARKVIRFISERIIGLGDHPCSGTKTNKAGI